MSKHGVTDAVTNTKEGSKAKVDYCCDTLWSMVQEKVYERLSDREGDHLTLIENYAVRARRIAGTYARLYLETEEGGDPSKKGRFYWMALGAFASKTVACTLEYKRVATQDVLSDTVIEGLGKGNFWLFQDVSAWHWYYTLNNNSFDMCAPKRNASNCAPQVNRCLNTLPWASDALPKLNQLQITDYVKKGFAKVKQIEGMGEGNKKRRPLQLKHLEDIANHEQLKILQPLIYDDDDFADWIWFARLPVINKVSPELSLVFASSCDTHKSELKSTAPPDTKLEDPNSRMLWIGKAAKMFHHLMQKSPAYMEGELQTIASWYNKADEFYTHKYVSKAKEIVKDPVIKTGEAIGETAAKGVLKVKETINKIIE